MFNRARIKQCPRIWMPRLRIDILRASLLHDASGEHNGHTVRDMFHYGQIVRNKQIGEVLFLLKIT